MLGKKYIILGFTLCLLFVAGNAMSAGLSGTVQGEQAGIEVKVTGSCVTNPTTDVTDVTGAFDVTWSCSSACTVSVVFTKGQLYNFSKQYNKCDTTIVGAVIVPGWKSIPTMTEWGWIALVVLIIAGSAIFILRRKRVTA